MNKIFIKIRSFDIDHESGVTAVIYHEWDGKYFCASCALDRQTISIPGVLWNDLKEIEKKILNQKYGIS